MADPKVKNAGKYVHLDLAEMFPGDDDAAKAKRALAADVLGLVSKAVAGGQRVNVKDGDAHVARFVPAA